MGFLGGSVVKNLSANTGDLDSVPGSRRSPGKGNDNPRLYFYLENPMDRGAWRATVHGSQRVGHDQNDLACTHTDIDIDMQVSV